MATILIGQDDGRHRGEPLALVKMAKTFARIWWAMVVGGRAGILHLVVLLFQTRDTNWEADNGD
eukprot:scaffold1581_cov124-Skeletonema_dohrnii-CCMP3373.AAC.7